MATEAGSAPAAPRPVALARSIATVGSLTLVSRLLGFVRDIMIAALLGAGPLADAFFVAFKLPNFLRRLFAEGAFNAGFVPMFARTLEGEGRAAAKAFAEQAQAIQVAVLVPLVVLTIVAMPWVMALLAPGFEFGSFRYEAAVELSRITFVYILFIALVALYGGVLNSLGRFAAAAAAPISLNLCLIGALILSALWLDAPAHALAWGVAAAGLVQFLWLRLALRREGMVPALHRPRLSPQIKRLFALILPGAIGAGVAQINLFVDVVLASLLPTGAVSYLYFADRVNQLPLGVIGVAVGTALLPLMARQLRAGQVEHAMHNQNRALELALLLTVPAAVALVVLSLPIVSVLFERGAFGAEASRATSAALAAYALGLPAYVLTKVLTPGFLRARGHQDAGQDRDRLPDQQCGHRLAADLVARACRDRARDRDLGLAERRSARARPAPRRLVPSGRPAPAPVAAHPRQQSRPGAWPVAARPLARRDRAAARARAADRRRRSCFPAPRPPGRRARSRRVEARREEALSRTRAHNQR